MSFRQLPWLTSFTVSQIVGVLYANVTARFVFLQFFSVDSKHRLEHVSSLSPPGHIHRIYTDNILTDPQRLVCVGRYLAGLLDSRVPHWRRHSILVSIGSRVW